MSHNRGGLLGGNSWNHKSEEDSNLLLWEAHNVVADSFYAHNANLRRLNDIIGNLQNTLEVTRVAYNQAIVDRDNKRAQLVVAESRLADVQRVITRYTVVQDPVVASDGYTYERAVIRQYLDECEASEASAYSQQTKEALVKDVLIPNQSLKKLVELLRMVKPSDVPAATPRSAIPPFKGGVHGNPVNWLDEEDGDDVRRPIHASDLEAEFSKPEQKPSETAKPAKAWGDANATKSSSTATTSSGRPTTGAHASQAKESSSSNGANRLHPCLRVYGFCNFKDDCTFARYPYDACLNNIKGKCRFGNNCKELHVNPHDAKYQNPRNAGGQRRD